MAAGSSPSSSKPTASSPSSTSSDAQEPASSGTAASAAKGGEGAKEDDNAKAIKEMRDMDFEGEQQLQVDWGCNGVRTVCDGP